MSRLRSHTTMIVRHSSSLPAVNTFLGPLATPKAIDVMAAIHGRVLTWDCNLRIVINGTWTAGAGASWTSDIDYDFTATSGLLSLRTLDTEKLLSDPADCLISGWSASGSTVIGTVSGTIAGAPTSANYEGTNMSLAAGAGFYAQSNNPVTNLESRIQFVSGEGYYFPFFFDTTGINSSFGFGTSFGLSTAAGFPLTPGLVTISIPDWMESYYPGVYSGTSEATIPIGLNSNSDPLDFSYSVVTCELTMIPATCLPYGLNPSDPLDYTTTNRIWNDDGSAALNPLAP